MTRVFVRNLSDGFDLPRTRELFAQYGPVHSIHLGEDGSGHRYNQCGFIQMDEAHARAAIAALDGCLLDGALLSVVEVSDPPREALPPMPGTRNTVPSPEALRFRVVAVAKSTGPEGAGGDDWFRYELAGGNSRITGFRRGTLDTVTEYAAAYGEHLNARKRGGYTAVRSAGYARKK